MTDPTVEARRARRRADRRRPSAGSYLVAAGILPLADRRARPRDRHLRPTSASGATADAFKAALRIPNLLQNLLGEGVLSASFIPVYATAARRGPTRRPAGVAGAVAGLLLRRHRRARRARGAVRPAPHRAPHPGLQRRAARPAVDLLRIMFPGIGFLVLSAGASAILNSHRRFFLSYVAPVLWNAAQIAFVVAAGVCGRRPRRASPPRWPGACSSAACSSSSSSCPPVRRAASRALRLSLDRRSPDVRSVIRRFGPVVVGPGRRPARSPTSTSSCASLLAVGAVSALTYAQVLYLLPISLFGMAVAAAELPELSRLGAAGADADQRPPATSASSASRFFVAPSPSRSTCSPATSSSARCSQRGEFTAADTALVWSSLAGFALGLLGTTRSRLLQNGPLRPRPTPPVARIAVVRVALAGVLGALLMFPLDRLRHRRARGRADRRPRLVGRSPTRCGSSTTGRRASASSAWPSARPRRRGSSTGCCRGALEWRIGGASPSSATPPLVADRRRRRWACCAAGLRAATDDLAAGLGGRRRGRRRSASRTSGSPPSMRVPEAQALVWPPAPAPPGAEPA